MVALVVDSQCWQDLIPSECVILHVGQTLCQFGFPLLRGLLCGASGSSSSQRRCRLVVLSQVERLVHVHSCEEGSAIGQQARLLWRVGLVVFSNAEISCQCCGDVVEFLPREGTFKVAA
eukprot:2597769-Rhodomonas_salina.1